MSAAVETDAVPRSAAEWSEREIREESPPREKSVISPPIAEIKGLEIRRVDKPGLSHTCDTQTRMTVALALSNAMISNASKEDEFIRESAAICALHAKFPVTCGLFATPALRDRKMASQ